MFPPTTSASTSLLESNLAQAALARFGLCGTCPVGIGASGKCRRKAAATASAREIPVDVSVGPHKMAGRK